MRRAMRHAQLLGAPEPLMWRLVPALVREMGQAYPELVRAEALIAETLQPGGDALPHHPRARPRPSRGGDAAARRARGPLRRDGVQALRHLWLPARPDPGRAPRAGPLGRRRGLQFGHGAPARRGPPRLGGIGGGRDRIGLVRRARTDRRDRLPRLRDRDRGGSDPGDPQGRRRGRPPRGGREGFDRPQPDAVLWRIGRAGRRRRRDHRIRVPRRRGRHPQEARRPRRPRRRDRRGERAAQHGGRTRRRPCRPVGDPGQPFGDPYPARGAPARAWRPRGAEGLARLARPPAVRLRPPEAGDGGGAYRGRGHRQPRRARERRGRRPA